MIRAWLVVVVWAWSVSLGVAQTTVTASRLRLSDAPCVIDSVDGSPDKLRFSTCPVLTTASATNLTLNPTGDLVLGPTGADVLPNVGYTQNLGSLANKYLTLHAAELWVETLVAQNTIATIGGRVLVAPTNILTSDLAPAGTSAVVKYNNFTVNDYIYMEADGKLEFIRVTAGPTGSGPYTYTITRNHDGSGANQWYAGDAMLNTGTTGDGFIDLYSVSGVVSASGPTIAGNVRTGGVWNNIATRWAIGNLNGLYGYGVETYGAAFGDSTAINVTVDATNGFRIRSGTTNKMVADTSGNLSLTGDLSVGASGVVRSSSASGFSTGDGFWLEGGSSPKFRIGNPAGNKLTYETSTGILSLTGNGGGLTSIGPGSLTVGLGRNMVRNSDCVASTVDWTAGTDSGLTQTLGFFLSTDWGLNGLSSVCYVTLAGTPAAGKISYGYIATANEYNVIAGNRYEASAYLGVHRSGNTTINIQWYNSSHTIISQSTGSTCTAASAGGKLLSGYCRSTLIATAPSGATTANILVLTTHTAELNPYVFWVHAYFGEALVNQTEATQWGPAGLTEIVGGVIKTSTITADKISVTSLSALSADIGTITAGTMSGVSATFGGGTVLLNSGGMLITSGAGDANKVRWDDGGYIRSSSDTVTVASDTGILLVTDGGTKVIDMGAGGSADIEIDPGSGERVLITRPTLTGGTVISGLTGSGTRFLCIDGSDVVFASGAACL